MVDNILVQPAKCVAAVIDVDTLHGKSRPMRMAEQAPAAAERKKTSWLSLNFSITNIAELSHPSSPPAKAYADCPDSLSQATKKETLHCFDEVWSLVTIKACYEKLSRTGEIKRGGKEQAYAAEFVAESNELNASVDGLRKAVGAEQNSYSKRGRPYYLLVRGVRGPQGELSRYCLEGFFT